MGNRVRARRVSPRRVGYRHGFLACEWLEARTLFSAPIVTATSPTSAGLAIAIGAKVSATFNEPIDRTTVGSATFTLHDSLGAAVPAVVSYNAANATATLDAAAPLAYSATYTATLSGGPGGVVDAEGEPLASDYNWSFTTAADPTTGPGGPILIVTSASNPFAGYYPEILRAEGLNEFSSADVSALSPTLLAQFQIVLLGETSLTPAQVGVLGDWVSGGGNLVAMRPDKQLAGLLGLSDAGATLADSYLQVNTGTGPGAGITDQTIQYHGVADEYALSGAASVATLYSDVATSTAHPAVTLRSVGGNGGQAAAFTYDLARSIVYTRQGNPAWAAQERDGQAPIRSDDLFFGNAASDPQPDYVNLNKVAIPQADEQQRLLANLIGQMNLDNNPLPRFWYFPRGAKAVVIMSGDDHGNGGTVGRFNTYLANSPANSSPDDWTAVRGSSYIYPSTPITDAQAAAFTAAGFEVGLHPTTLELNWTPTSLEQTFATQLAQFRAAFPSLPSPSTSRTHAIVWSDYATQPEVELNHRIRLDENYYYWPGTWIQDRPGMFTGSGMPMRFATATGDMIDVYQAATQMTDESGQTYPKNINALLDNALGGLGYYGAFTANMHTDSATSAGSSAIVAAAQARGVPVVSGRQMLAWLDGRNGSSFGSIHWDAAASTLSFTVTSADGASGLQGMVPTHSAGAVLGAITVNGVAVPFSVQTIKGVEYAFYPAAAGDYTAQYVPDTTAPVVSGVLAAPAAPQSETITWATDEPATTRVDYGTAPDSLTLSATSSVLTTAHQVLLTGLTPGATYYYRVTSADFAGNLTASPPAGSPAGSFAVASGQFTDTTASDFAAGSGDSNTYIAHSDDGELTLAPTIAAEFSGTSLPADWSSSPWSAGGGVSVAGGSATISGSLLARTSTFSPGHTLEFVATFGGEPFQHIGLGTDLNAPPWAIFSTGSTIGSLRARTSTGGAGIDTPIPGNWAGAPHRFRIDWGTGSVSYWIDGIRVASHAVAVAGPSRPVASDLTIDGNTVSIDWVHMTPYATPASFVSRVFSASGPSVWSAVEWDAQVPAGTSVDMLLRTGDTATPDETWGAFVPIGSSGAPLAAPGRYAQYRADLATTDPDQAPLVRDVSVFFYNTVTDTTPPTITASSPAPNATGVALAQGVSVTFSEAMDPATIRPATLRLRAAGSATDVAASVSYDPSTQTATLQPVALLSANSSYQVTVASDVADVAGNPLGTDATWAFATVDTIAPTVVARSPATGATGVAIGAAVSVTFSEAMTAATVNGTTFQLRDASNNLVAAVVNYDAATQTATLQPAAPLSANASYQVTVSGAVADVAGNTLGADASWSFATVDTIPPAVVARSPAPGANGVGVGTAVSVTFSEAMNAATISAATLRLRAAGSATDVAAGVSYDAGTRTATLLPSAPLSANASYQVTVAGTVTDLAGNALGADVTWAFATVDTIAPTVVARSPAPGAVGVALGVAVTVTFSEAMAPATVNGTTFQLRDAANNVVAAVVSYNSATNVATLTPSAPLGSLVTYTATVSGATDLAGNALAASVTWSFATVDAPPSVIAQSPAPGTIAVTPGTTVTVTFSESIQPKTLSFVLRNGSGSTVAANISYNDATRTATLTPKSNLASATTYTATVSGAKDLAGKPMSSVSWSFTTVVPWVQATASDFAAGTHSGTMTTNTADGEVQLASPIFEDFTGAAALPSTWTSLSLAPSGGGPTSVTVSGGVVSVAGANVVSNQTFANAPVEGRVQFGAAANQSFGATNDAGTNFAVFTTKNTTNSLYAQVSANGTITEVRIGLLPSGFHVYRVTPVATGFEFYVDGSRKATIARTLPAGTLLRASVSAFYGSPRPAILADWVHVLSYAPGGVFTSGVFDATRTATWGTITFNGTVPAGTTMVVEVSSGNTATPDSTWSAWTRVSSGATITAPAGRYLRYRVTFTTTDSTLTAVLRDLTVTWR